MEEENYIANYSSMVLVKEVYISTNCKIQCDFELYAEQMLGQEDNNDEVPSGYKCRIKLEKLGVANPSMIHIEKCLLWVGNQREKGEGSYLIDLENLSENYSRIAIGKEDLQLEMTIFVQKAEQIEFAKAIKNADNRVTVNFDFKIVTDRYVATKCRCRADCYCNMIDDTISWISKEPKVFFYGNEIVDKKTIKIQGEG